jgi:hypothetical protein
LEVVDLSGVTPLVSAEISGETSGVTPLAALNSFDETSGVTPFTSFEIVEVNGVIIVRRL